MVKIISLNCQCCWYSVFSILIEISESMQINGCTDDDLILVSSAIMHLFHKESGFADYAPLEFNHRTGCYYFYIGAENFSEVAWNIYSIAEEILKESRGRK